MDSAQLELMQTILHNDGEIVLANNERIVVPDTLRFIWEVRPSLHLTDFSYHPRSFLFQPFV